MLYCLVRPILSREKKQVVNHPQVELIVALLGFFLIFSSGISDDPKAWPGVVDPSEWDPAAPPSMEIDWVRVYVNDRYAGAPAPEVKYY